MLSEAFYIPSVVCWPCFATACEYRFPHCPARESSCCGPDWYMCCSAWFAKKPDSSGVMAQHGHTWNFLLIALANVLTSLVLWLRQIWEIWLRHKWCPWHSFAAQFVEQSWMGNCNKWCRMRNGFECCIACLLWLLSVIGVVLADHWLFEWTRVESLNFEWTRIVINWMTAPDRSRQTNAWWRHPKSRTSIQDDKTQRVEDKRPRSQDATSRRQASEITRGCF